MPALIQNVPTFQPFSFEQYIAPLEKYKEAYNEVEKQYNEIEATASALEALAADDPHSQAYRTYRNYIDSLRAEADALAYNGLTPGSRSRLRNMRSKYASDIIPIVRGMEKWEKEKERARNLKSGEIMSSDPFRLGIDYYIGANPSSRIINLENVRKNAELTGQAWSERLYGDLSPLTLDGIYDGAAAMMSQLQGFIAGGPEGQNSITELRNAAQSLSKGTTDPYSEGIMLLANQLEALGYDQFDAQGKKEILNSVLMGYGQGLKGSYQYRNSPYTTSSSGRSGSPIIKGMPAVHSRTIPLLGNSTAAQQALKDLGATHDDKTGVWSYEPNNPAKYKTSILIDARLSSGQSYKIPLEDAIKQYQSIINGSYTTESNTYSVNPKGQEQLQNIINTISIYDPDTADKIKNGTFNGDIHEVIKNVVNNIQTNTKDYGVKIFDVTYADKQDTKVLTEAIGRYLESNKGEYEIQDLSSDGKSFNDTDTEKVKLDDYTLEVVGVSFLPTDPKHIIVNAYVDGQQKQMKMPVTAINDQAMQALDIVNQHALAYNKFEAEHGTFQQPPTKGTPSDMENIWMEIRKVDEQYKTRDTSKEKKLEYQKAVFEALEKLATTNGKEIDYYTKLFQQYLQLEYATSMMYPQFVQNFGYAIGTVDNQDYKQDTYHEVASGTK